MGGGEVYLGSKVLGNPDTNILLLMSCTVIHDIMDIQFGGHAGIDVGYKLEELLMPMPLLVLAHHLATGKIETAKERCRAASQIIMRLPFQIARFHGKRWSTALKGQVLAFPSTQRTSTLVGRFGFTAFRQMPILWLCNSFLGGRNSETQFTSVFHRKETL